MLIHAYNRTKPTTVDLHGQKIQFKPDEHGKVVADVTDKKSIDLLLSITEGYQKHSAGDDREEPEVSPFILTQEDDNGHEVTVDLREMNRDQLMEFCSDHEIPAPHSNAKDDTVRQKIVDFFKVE